MSQGKPPYMKTGTTAPIYVPRNNASRPVRPGEYFIVKVLHAQAAFRGSIWQTVRQLLVTSKINLNHPLLGNEEFFGLQRSRQVKREEAVQLGLSSNLISLVPATMDRVSVSFEYVLDIENNLAKLGSLINDDSFLAVVSLAPGATAVAKTISSLAQKVIQSFIPANEQKPILQFAGDFNISAEGEDMRDGYYVILGSNDEYNPLPNPIPQLTVTDESLTVDGVPLTQLSYVVLNVLRVPARTRKLGANTAWDLKLREAERIIDESMDDPYADDEEKREVWSKCKLILREADALIMADPNYAPDEARDLVKSVYKQCADKVAGRGEYKSVVKGATIQTDTPSDRAQLGLGESENLAAIVDVYEQRVAEASRILDTVQ